MRGGIARGLGVVLLATLIVAYGGRGWIVAQSLQEIYVTEDRNNRIVRMNDPTGTGWTTFGAEGGEVNQFNSPAGIFVDSTGHIYLVDSGNNRIVRMDDMTGAGWTTLGSEGSGVNQFQTPAGIFVDPAGRIYVTDFYVNERIVRVNDLSGAGWTALRIIDGASVNPIQLLVRTLEAPNTWSGVSVDPAGRIYVTDLFNDQIIRVNDMSGVGRTALGGTGAATNQFRFPAGIFVDLAGRIHVTDSFNHRIVRINNITGAGWTTLGSRGNGTNQFNGPSSIFVRWL